MERGRHYEMDRRKGIRKSMKFYDAQMDNLTEAEIKSYEKNKGAERA